MGSLGFLAIVGSLGLRVSVFRVFGFYFPVWILRCKSLWWVLDCTVVVLWW